MQIFIVDDSPLVRSRLVEMLDQVPGAQVAGEAADAAAAIEQILAYHPDLVLCDLNLGEGSGFDVLRAVRPQAPQIEFYMLSNFSADPYRQLAGRLGAREFFDKSKEFERMRGVIAQRAAGKQ